MKLRSFYLFAIGALMPFLQSASAAEPPCYDASARSSSYKLGDLVYKRVGERALKLDLYLPGQGLKNSPVLIWIHGGGWREGKKEGAPILPLLSSGFAVASIEYRLSGQASFPAQIEDVKAAIRWLRAHSSEYKLDPGNFGVIGHSAGGHLAALAGTTGSGSAFDVGDNLGVSSKVQAVCVMSGPSDLVAMFDGADDHRRSALEGLLGGPLAKTKKLAESASPINYIGPGLPPFMFIHGADDQVVPVQQAKSMIQKLDEVGAKPKSIILSQTGHDVFVRNQQYCGEVRTFFMNNLFRR